MKKLILLFGLFSAVGSHAAQVITMQCGNFRFEMIENSMARINGEYVTSQKITEFGKNGAKVEMTLMPASDGNLYGFEYIHPDGSKKQWMNVELIRTNLNQGRIIGTFDCKRVKG
ncbi:MULTISPECIES: hypothetical protein [Klebsiella pneumoniae complex]|uniref:hypothetical protein n=1 Tax=Klebsiella pneumoniae complex TaxID=3390273 RepID=UPI000D743717|nr:MULTISPECIES: hypothetical protein [Klebsiella]HCB1001047.1 hypothetical protein [Klebsiella variicola subsp. variicola]MDU5536555.1 hypothetical protein [Klebsiella pneumoniae]MDZ0372952.1 hypothetical protein [Klebsiella pneumoniae]PXL58976.1 hypothetical protein DMS35_03185 [Klebsiella variicola]RTQ96724.1 hypothetical protein EKL47_24990 [Klebsiella pneumoniae]